MYLEHFGFDELPFGLTPNTRFVVEVPAFREALQVLLVALRAGEGFAKVVGEVGTGKSLLCRRLLHELDADFHSVYVPNPALEPDELLCEVAEELGLAVQGEAGGRLTSRIARRLVDLYTQGRPVVVVVDEAQGMPDATLEALRLLTNLETESHKLLQVVLLGQPELDARLARRQLRQLRQRILVPQRLRPLDADEVRYYVEQRLYVAGCRRPGLFTPSALALLHRASRGLPRLVNVLAHKSLLCAYGAGDTAVGRAHARRAVADTEDARPRRLRVWRRLVVDRLGPLS